MVELCGVCACVQMPGVAQGLGESSGSGGVGEEGCVSLRLVRLAPSL